MWTKGFEFIFVLEHTKQWSIYNAYLYCIHMTFFLVRRPKESNHPAVLGGRLQ